MVDLAHQAHGQGNVQVDAQHIDSLLAEYAQCFVLRIVGDYLTDLLIAEARGLYNAGDLNIGRGGRDVGIQAGAGGRSSDQWGCPRG